MPWQNQSGGNNNNPWGRGSNGGGPRNPWGNGGGGGNEPPPDLDDLIRKAQANLKDVLPGNLGGGKIIALLVLVIAALWFASGFYIVQPAEHAVIQKFGAFDRVQVEPGLHYHLPFPIEQVTKVNVTEIRTAPIGFRETITRAGEGKQNIPEESLMLTSDANIVDLQLVVQWNIKAAENYIFRIINPEDNVKQIAESAIREVVGQMPMFSIITQERAEVAKRAREIMTKTLDDYQAGVNVTQVLIQAAEMHPDVQGAFQDVQSAKQDAIDKQNKAEAYREDILPKARGQATQILNQARGYKEAVTARATGDADRFSSIYESYSKSKDVTRERMYIETMERIFQRANKTIIDQPGASGSGVVPYLPLNELKRVRPAAGGSGSSLKN